MPCQAKTTYHDKQPVADLQVTLVRLTQKHNTQGQCDSGEVGISQSHDCQVHVHVPVQALST